MRLSLQNQKCNMERIPLELERNKYLPLQMQWVVNSEASQFQNQVVPRLSFEILSCSITHEMLGPEEVRNIPRNHWHETAAPPPPNSFSSCPWMACPWGLAATQGKEWPFLPSSWWPSQATPQLPVGCHYRLKQRDQADLGKGTETKTRLFSCLAMTRAGLKLISSSFLGSLPYEQFSNKNLFQPRLYWNEQKLLPVPSLPPFFQHSWPSGKNTG